MRLTGDNCSCKLQSPRRRLVFFYMPRRRVWSSGVPPPLEHTAVAPAAEVGIDPAAGLAMGHAAATAAVVVVDPLAGQRA